MVTRPLRLGPKKARHAAEQVAADLKSEYGLEYTWAEDDVLAFKRPGLSGQLRLQRKQVVVELRLGLMLSPFRSSLQRHIEEFFDQRFPAASA